MMKLHTQWKVKCSFLFLFLETVQLSKRSPADIPGSLEYNAAFCHILAKYASADAASIWQVEKENQLRLVASTDISLYKVRDITLRQGEGIIGAAALSRQPVFVVNAQKQKLHDSRIDERLGLRTYAIVSAPILFEDHLFGVANILNHHSDKLFLRRGKDGSAPWQ